jgi:hypothetical protein
MIPISMVNPKPCTAGTPLNANRPNESSDVVPADQTASKLVELAPSAQKIA